MPGDKIFIGRDYACVEEPAKVVYVSAFYGFPEEGKVAVTVFRGRHVIGLKELSSRPVDFDD